MNKNTEDDSSIAPVFFFAMLVCIVGISVFVFLQVTEIEPLKAKVTDLTTMVFDADKDIVAAKAEAARYKQLVEKQFGDEDRANESICVKEQVLDFEVFSVKQECSLCNLDCYLRELESRLVSKDKSRCYEDLVISFTYNKHAIDSNYGKELQAIEEEQIIRTGLESKKQKYLDRADLSIDCNKFVVSKERSVYKDVTVCLTRAQLARLDCSEYGLEDDNDGGCCGAIAVESLNEAGEVEVRRIGRRCTNKELVPLIWHKGDHPREKDHYPNMG